ncbi:SPOR domain-containing protein [Paenibacillus phoenicis]|uniref:SPOR domain-containing protein n=1 Tax=Paenibacillus phoenicis TaxID=554117 RepID=A0ABU5PLR4_9BACL|nr:MULTISPECIES: SPOR domain-containing protein [Paenibacillus]MCT2196079.1 SPOR domain-containing protein [Paenibacillus sp. p3-SID1389]MEA3570762.1 SPOR domain-containing protein [Paenibacillus phoenicis]
MNKAKMTFRFDRDGREIRPEREIAEEPIRRTTPQYRAVETVEEWGDPFTDHTGMGLTVFPGGQDQRQRQDPMGTTRDDWEEIYDKDPWQTEWQEETPPIYTRPHRTSWWKVAGSLTGAIVTGALFGYVVLSLFNQEIELPLPGINTNTPQQVESGDTASQPAMGEIEGEDPATEDNVPLISVALPEQTYYFLQYGVFSTAQGVQLAQEELQASGIAAARDTVDEKRVYAGVSTDREQSKLLTGQLKAAGVNLILHEISFPAAANVPFAGEREALEGFMAQSAELVDLLSTSSAALLTEADPQPQQHPELEQLGAKHQAWTQSASAIRGKWSTAGAALAGEMEKAINGAVEAMSEYQKNGAKTLLWEVQNEMMRFIMAEQSLVHDGV